MPNVYLDDRFEKGAREFAQVHGWTLDQFVTFCVWRFVDPKSLPIELQVGNLGLSLPPKETDNETRRSENG